MTLLTDTPLARALRAAGDVTAALAGPALTLTIYEQLGDHPEVHITVLRSAADEGARAEVVARAGAVLGAAVEDYAYADCSVISSAYCAGWQDTGVAVVVSAMTRDPRPAPLGGGSDE